MQNVDAAILEFMQNLNRKRDWIAMAKSKCDLEEYDREDPDVEAP